MAQFMIKGEKLSDEELLLRRVYRKDKRYINQLTGRPSSRAFAPRPKDEGKLSVDIERLTTKEKCIIDPGKFVLFQVKASVPHNAGLKCIYDPLKYEEDGVDNPAHALITGFDLEDESVPGILARQAQRLNYP